MRQNTVGILLGYYREKYQVKQEEICEEICSVSTLSRLEKGNREADSLICEMLLSRVGKTAFEFELMLDEDDYQKWQMRENIKEAIKRKDTAALKLAMSLYEEIPEAKNPVHRQFLLYSTAQCMILEGQPAEKIAEVLEEALVCTGREKGRRRLYSWIEVELIQQKIHFSGEKNYLEQENLLKYLFESILPYYGKKEKDRLELLFLQELYLLEEKRQDKEKMLFYLERQIDVVCETKTVFPVAGLRFEKAKLIKELYDKTDVWEEKRKESIRECIMAYYVYQVAREKEKEEEVARYCMEELQWHITASEV